MPSYRYDNLQLSTVLPNFINVSTDSTSLNCSGSIPSGNTVTVGSNYIDLNSKTSFFDVYVIGNLKNRKISVTDPRSYFDLSTGVWSYAGSEVMVGTYSAGTGPTGALRLSFNITAFNPTGATITITNQTLTYFIVQYQLPI
jgi:hypothetical protein